MNALTLCIFVYILTTAVTVYGCRTCKVKLGKKCSKYRQCCEGDCINGICIEPPLTCENFTCPDGQECFIPTVMCLAIGVCNPQPQCRDKVIVIDENPCNLMDCANGYTCLYEPVKCSVGPCPQTEAKCVLIDPCVSTICVDGYECIRNVNNSTLADCVQKDPCAALVCSTGFECSPVLEKCVAIPGPCDSLKCGNGYDCVPRRNDPSYADCVAKDVCAGVKCSDGWKCQMAVMHDQCVEPPCNPVTYAECVPDFFK